ncbi:hypothetical protein G5I_14422 [Acromyrmex echinatior]|uniref:Uncharacterized protein n=1 Tax=Acromyrmex echinatior TaxID=103372 RepID=F4X7N8_ACREC|nr:hypothetical protein G5I_14422 [Acromyrmex echinatior]
MTIGGVTLLCEAPSHGDNEGEWGEYGRTVRLNLTDIRAEANICESYAPFKSWNVGQRPKGRYDTCSTGQCEYVVPTFSVKELNPFDPGLDLVRSQVFKGRLQCDKGVGSCEQFPHLRIELSRGISFGITRIGTWHASIASNDALLWELFLHGNALLFSYFVVTLYSKQFDDDVVIFYDGKGLNTIGVGNRHRQKGITSHPIRTLGYNIEFTHQSSDWTACYSLLPVPIAYACCV